MVVHDGIQTAVGPAFLVGLATGRQVLTGQQMTTAHEEEWSGRRCGPRTCPYVYEDPHPQRGRGTARCSLLPRGVRWQPGKQHQRPTSANLSFPVLFSSQAWAEYLPTSSKGTCLFVTVQAESSCQTQRASGAVHNGSVVLDRSLLVGQQSPCAVAVPPCQAA